MSALPESTLAPDPPTPGSDRTLPAAQSTLPISHNSGERSLVGHIIAGRYEVLTELGRGGMGLVFSARHIGINKTVAVKVLRSGLAQNAEAITRFQREARAAASIGNPHIVEVFDFGYTDDGDAYIAMELLEGMDLRRAIREAKILAIPRAIELGKQIAKALGAAHERGIVHRDLKSENVFLVDRDGHEHVKLLDFGISKVTEYDDAQGPLTSDGVLMGTPHYMAPELVHGATIADARADIYSMGCVLYEMVTGMLPFTGKTPMEVAFKHVHDSVVPPGQHNPLVPPQLEAVILRALQKNPDDRFSSAEQILDALRKAETEPTSLVPTKAPSKADVRTERRRYWLPGLAAVALLTTIAVVAWPRAPVAVIVPRIPANLAMDQDSGANSTRTLVATTESTQDAQVQATATGQEPQPDNDDGGAEGSSTGGRPARVGLTGGRNLGRDAQVGATQTNANGSVETSANVGNNDNSASRMEVDSGHVRNPDDGLKQTPYGRLPR